MCRLFALHAGDLPAATSILREFSLDVISTYFPGYPAEIGPRLGGSDPGT